jgi:hypothetical protein
MAEYYPLLAKAVGGLPNSTMETRHAVYERARTALLGQLRAVQPPVPEADIEMENQALDKAIARLEAEYVAIASTSPTNEAPPVSGPVRQVPDAPSAPPVAAAIPVAPPQSAPHQTSEAPRAPAAPPSPLRPRTAPTAVPNPFNDTEGAPSSSSAEIKPGPAARSLPPRNGEGNASASPAKTRSEPQRPIAPQVQGTRQGPRGLWIVLTVIGLIIASVAFVAWKLRDRPEDLAKVKTAQTQQQTEASGKIVGRVNENTQPKSTTTAAVATGAASSQTDTATNVPVTYRAALLVQAPENQVKTYFGTVIWRLDNVSNGPGEPVGTAIHANVDIPEDKLQTSVTLQKNVDASLPASHTMTIVFTVQPTTPTGTVKQIGLPQMRKEDSATGDALIGLPVPIMENSFLIGLTKGNPEATNLDLLKTRQWIDIPMLLADGRIAKLTFEKGVAGLRATEDAIASWQTQ